MNRFCCKHCGMITDEPTIVPHPDKDAEYRDKMSHYKGKPSAFFLINTPPYNHSITCPVCENETRFWRDKPFPSDIPIDEIRRATNLLYRLLVEQSKE